MRKQRLLIWMTCLLLGAVSGCSNHPTTSKSKTHTPVSGDIDAKGNASNGPKRSVLIDEGGMVNTNGTLTIKLPKPGTEFEIKSTTLDGKTLVPVCGDQSNNPFTTSVDSHVTLSIRMVTTSSRLQSRQRPRRVLSPLALQLPSRHMSGLVRTANKR